MGKKLGFTFHRTFKFKRGPTSSILKFIDDYKGNEHLSKKIFLENIDFGTIYAEAYPRYAIGTGLLNPTSKSLTNFGAYIATHDPQLNRITTLWMMHYHISSSQGAGPLFWNFIVNNYFQPNNSFTTDDICKGLFSFNLSTNGINYASRVLKTTASIFIQSYLTNEGFGELNILSTANQNTYKINSSKFNNALILGYAINHLFQYNSSNGDVFLEDILDSELKNIFMQNEDQITTSIHELIAYGLFTINDDLGKISFKIKTNPMDYLESIYI